MARSSTYPPSVQPGKPRLLPLPAGWATVTFGDIFEVVERPIALQDDQRYQLITAKRSRGGIVPRERLAGREILTKTQFSVAEGDFLISNRQIIHGGCGIVPLGLDGAVVSNEYTVLRPKTILSHDYLHYLPHTVFFQQTCFNASVGVDVEKMVFDIDQWLSFRVNLPPLPEQRRIAEILSSVDETIQATRAVIEQTRKVKQGVLKRLLTRGIGHTRFKQTEIGEIPQSWAVAPVGAVATFQPGYPFKSAEFSEEGDKLLRGSNIGVSQTDWDSRHTRYFPSERRNEFRDYVLRKGDIVIAMDRPFISSGFKIARISNKDLPALLLQRVGRLQPKNCNSDWLWQILNVGALRNHLEQRQVGTDLPHISKKDVETCLVPVPPLAEQVEIAAALEALDDAVTSNSFEYLLILKAALMSDLLTGRKRVLIDDLAAAE